VKYARKSPLFQLSPSATLPTAPIVADLGFFSASNQLT